MKFTVTLHFAPQFTPVNEPDTWEKVIREKLEAISGVHKAEVEPEGRKGIGEQ